MHLMARLILPCPMNPVPSHLKHVGEGLVLLDDLGQVGLCLGVLLLLEVASTQGQQLLERLIHIGTEPLRLLRS